MQFAEDQSRQPIYLNEAHLFCHQGGVITAMQPWNTHYLFEAIDLD